MLEELILRAVYILYNDYLASIQWKRYNYIEVKRTRINLCAQYIRINKAILREVTFQKSLI